MVDPNGLTRRASTAIVALLALLCIGLLAPAAQAAKPTGSGGGKGGGGPKPSGSGTISLVLLDSSDGVPHWSQRVRFDVTTTATSEPHVSLQCSQGGTLVYSAQTGYYDSYPWPATQTFTLSSASWTGGGADCTARLYSLSSNGSTSTLGTLAVHVDA